MNNIYQKSRICRSHDEAREVICFSCGRKCKTDQHNKTIVQVDDRFSALIA